VIKEEGEHFKNWKFDVVNNPDPILNEVNRSVIASYELIDEKIGYWCTKSFEITNRMSKLYKGQDDDIFIFSRVNSTSETQSKEGQSKAERTNHI